MDSYRPGGHGGQPGYGDLDSYRPAPYNSRRPESKWPSRDDKNGMYYFQGNQNDYARRPNNRRSGGFDHSTRSRDTRARSDRSGREHARRPPFLNKIHERPLLRLNHDAPDGLSLLDPKSRSKFRNLDELTDSEEEEMAQSDSDDEEQQPAPKRTRTIPSDSNVVSTPPRWSNPDPYTSLPPAGDFAGAAKRTDVVKLIRKARIETSRDSENSKSAADFISFHSNDPETDGESNASSMSTSDPQKMAEDVVLGKRKRGDVSGASIGRALPGKRPVQKEWRAAEDIDPTPWLSPVGCADLPGIALHKEIVDFYDWVKPKQFEERVRAEVFNRLRTELQRLMPGQLKAFGSYAAGLYLPTGDMDLVFLRQSYRPGVLVSKSESQRLVRHFSSYLRRSLIAAAGTIVPILWAKVPIIKFVDRVSGLKIDLSFDNDTGVVAIETFRTWKELYPSMPIIVSIVKQYLMIRGLNDVSTGGLGGFSTICLVVSLLQHMPIGDQPLNLGHVLLEFFNYYGNLFDKSSVAIRLDPPGYLDKSSHMRTAMTEKQDRLTIIDPNCADNNISGGSKSIDEIIQCFSAAHRALLDGLAAYEDRRPLTQPRSLLGCLIGGDFGQYDISRRKLYSLFAAGIGDRAAAEAKLPPKPPPTSGAAISETHKNEAKRSLDPKTANHTLLATSDSTPPSGGSGPASKTAAKSIRRAIRLKRLRPELASSIRDSLSRKEALIIGGYESPEQMDKDLQAKESALSKTNMMTTATANIV